MSTPDIDFYDLSVHWDSVVRIAVYYLLFHFRIPVFCGITAIKSYGMDFVDFAAYLVSFLVVRAYPYHRVGFGLM